MSAAPVLACVLLWLISFAVGRALGRRHEEERWRALERGGEEKGAARGAKETS